jgi:hypothetical protein
MPQRQSSVSWKILVPLGIALAAGLAFELTCAGLFFWRLANKEILTSSILSKTIFHSDDQPPGFRAAKDRIEVVGQVDILDSDPKDSNCYCGWAGIGKQVVYQREWEAKGT